MEEVPPTRRSDRLSWAVFLVLAAVYRWGRCPSFGGGDSPVVVYNALFGHGHDPVIYLARLASKIPFDSPEGQINALSGLFHAAAAALLFGLLRRLGLKRVPALAAVVLLAFSRRYWYYALIAGYAPGIVFGFALALWGVVAWKDEAKAWPLVFSFVGAILYGATLRFSESLLLSALGLWCAALAAALVLQRLETASPPVARFVLAAACIVPIARPYTLRRHNPTLEWADAAVEPIRKGENVSIPNRGLRYAAAYASRKKGLDASVILEPRTFLLHGRRRQWTDVLSLEQTGNPPLEWPNGVLLASIAPSHFSLKGDAGYPPNAHGVIVVNDKAPDEAEIARRADAVLALPALSSIGLRDRAKYGFAEESILYAEYRGILNRYRELLPNHPELRARLDTQLAEYGTH